MSTFSYISSISISTNVSQRCLDISETSVRCTLDICATLVYTHAEMLPVNINETDNEIDNKKLIRNNFMYKIKRIYLKESSLITLQKYTL